MFIAAGKMYLKEGQLTHKKIGEYQGKWRLEPIYEDVHGRKVLALYERFPCFDSYDFLYENRFYNWYYIKDDNKIAVVYTVDESNELEVCNDIFNEDRSKCCIRSSHFESLRAAGFL